MKKSSLIKEKTERSNMFNVFLRMKILVTIFILTIFCVSARSRLLFQSSKVSLNYQQTKILDVLNDIENQTEYLFYYDKKAISADRKVNIKVVNKPVSEVLDILFSKMNVGYKMVDKNIVISPILSEKKTKELARPQQIATIQGTILNSSGIPVVGASIVEIGTSHRTSTDDKGHFTLRVQPNSIIRVSYVGYESQEIKILKDTLLNIQLLESTAVLDEIVVTALGIKRSEKALGYATQKVTGESLNTVKGVDISSMLTGKIAGLSVLNTTEFNQDATIRLRGENTLLIIDGIPTQNMSLSNIASDDIESINVLKGPTATALYGSMGNNGAIMVTTKKSGKTEGISVSVNSNTMFFAGHLAFPKAQSSYSYGFAGKYDDVSGYVWGDKLDIGRKAVMWDPYLYEKTEQELVSKGKSNFKNFLEPSLVTNNNVSVSQKGKYGSFRSSLTHVYNKGQYPNQKLNNFNYYVGGEMNFGKFKLDAAASLNKRISPNDAGAGYYSSSYIYDMVIWGGTEYDIRDYKNNYWIKGKENIQQNWYDKNWYDNPYFKAYEVIKPTDKTIVNTYFNAVYDISPWLKAMLRAGMDTYSDKFQNRNAMSANYSGDKRGYFSTSTTTGYNVNTDAILLGDKTWGKFNLSLLIGGNLNYLNSDNQFIQTAGGITIPGFYSIQASVDPVQTPYDYSNNRNVLKRKQINSIYGKSSLSWDNKYFIDITGRNDWSSTLMRNNRSYFYPSVAGSVVLSEIIKLPSFWNFWKVRSSWTMTKQDAGIYANNNVYDVKINRWNGLGAASFPNSVIGQDIFPEKSTTMEFGTAGNFFKNRLYTDFAYFRKLESDFIINGGVSQSTGFASIQTNSKEQLVRNGFELTIGGIPIETKNFKWDILTNWSRDVYKYKKLDPAHSTNRPWIKEGARVDWFELYDWERDPDGNVIHSGGMPIQQSFLSKRGNIRPDLVWGITNTLRYKQLTLNFSFDGRIGGMAFSRTVQTMFSSGSHIDTDTKWRYDEVVDGKTNYIGSGVKVISGDVKRDAEGNILEDNRKYSPNDVPVSYQAYVLRYNDGASKPKWQNVFDETFFKLRNISISYALSPQLSRKLGLQKASVGITGQNLFLWTKEFKMSDPDKGADASGYENLNSPSQRYIGMNFQLSF